MSYVVLKFKLCHSHGWWVILTGVANVLCLFCVYFCLSTQDSKGMCTSLAHLLNASTMKVSLRKCRVLLRIVLELIAAICQNVLGCTLGTVTAFGAFLEL